MKLILGLIFIAVVSMMVPAYAQIAALGPTPNPTPEPCDATEANFHNLQCPPALAIAQCIDFNQDKICEYVVLANGTMIANPALQSVLTPTPTPAPMSQLVERQKTIIKEVQRDNNEDEDE